MPGTEIRAQARPVASPAGLALWLSREDLLRRVGELAQEIARDYAGRDPVLLAHAPGATPFARDLGRALTALALSHERDQLQLVSYPQAGAPRLAREPSGELRDRDVIVVENVVDTGLTLRALLTELRSRQPRSLAVCALANRPYRRLVEDLPLAYVGFTAPDELFAGYGFALETRYQTLPGLYVLR